MWEAFQRFKALDSNAQKLFGHAVILFPWVLVSLRFRGFKKTQASLQKKLPRESQCRNRNAAETVQTVCRLVKAGGHYGIVHPNCLEESLVLWYFLQRENVTAALRIGVRKSRGEFEAHAWVEYQGAALNQGAWTHPHYAAFEAEFSELPGENL
jgi:Transglutaminase-like superfamily